MTRCDGCGWDHRNGQDRLSDAIDRVNADPRSVTTMDDHLVTALAAWAVRDDTVIRAEAERRRALHQGLADQFASSLKDRP
jgi:hypothetical protein